MNTAKQINDAFEPEVDFSCDTQYNETPVVTTKDLDHFQVYQTITVCGMVLFGENKAQQKLTLSKEKDPLLTKLEIFQSQFGTSKTVLTFGDKPTPAMAQLALRKTADKAKSSYPEAAQVLKNNTYMDDICDSVNSIKQAKRLTNELDEVLLKVKGWLLNQSLENEIVGQEKPEMKVLRGTTQEKILRTVWDHAKDMLFFNVDPPNDITLTERIVLSQISRTFDPVRFAAAFLVRAKIGMQRL